MHTNAAATEESSYLETVALHEAAHIVVGLHEPRLGPAGWHVLKPECGPLEACATFDQPATTPTSALRVNLAGIVGEAILSNQDPQRCLAERALSATPEDVDMRNVALLTSLLDDGPVYCWFPDSVAEVRGRGQLREPRFVQVMQRLPHVAEDLLRGRFDEDIEAIRGILSMPSWRQLGAAVLAMLTGERRKLLHSDVALGVEANITGGPDGWAQAIAAWRCPQASGRLDLPVAMELVPENREFLDNRGLLARFEAAARLRTSEVEVNRMARARMLSTQRVELPSGHCIDAYPESEIARLAIDVGQG